MRRCSTRATFSPLPTRFIVLASHRFKSPVQAVEDASSVGYLRSQTPIAARIGTVFPQNPPRFHSLSRGACARSAKHRVGDLSFRAHFQLSGNTHPLFRNVDGYPKPCLRNV